MTTTMLKDKIKKFYVDLSLLIRVFVIKVAIRIFNFALIYYKWIKAFVRKFLPGRRAE